MFKLIIISVLLFFLGYGFISFVFRTLGGNRSNRQSPPRNRNNTAQQNPQQDKRYSKDIGEYVSYEEVKDDEVK